MKKHLQRAMLILAAGFLSISFLSISPAAVAQSPSPHFYRSGNEWIQEVSGTFSAGKIVKVKSSNGAIRIVGAQQNNITYTIREHVRAVTDGGTVAANDLAGKVEAKTGAGAIQLDRISGMIVVSSGGGNIEIGKVGSDVHASTGGGRIRWASAAGDGRATS